MRRLRKIYNPTCHSSWQINHVLNEYNTYREKRHDTAKVEALAELNYSIPHFVMTPMSAVSYGLPTLRLTFRKHYFTLRLPQTAHVCPVCCSIHTQSNISFRVSEELEWLVN